jgi:hypothetical protein
MENPVGCRLRWALILPFPLGACDRFFIVDGTVRTEPIGRTENAILTIERFDERMKVVRTDTLPVLSDGQFGDLLRWVSSARSARLQVSMTGYKTVTLCAPAESLRVGSWHANIVVRR